ncbi:MAG TPA: FAD-binding oxidoreductase, partial [Actinomycetota bacterium]|nr:FAD-binding oxidoreductase [Actinomycetota bacterium]
MARERADLVIVGAGTIGGWASVFAREAGVRDVVVLEREQAGAGASGRAAGMVRAQGGTPDTVRLGSWSIDFYASQGDRYDTDSGFLRRGYVILATTARGERAARDRIAMQRAVGLDARWVDVDEIRHLIPAMAGDGYRGGSYVATDGWVDPPRNVRAYSLAMQRAAVSLREGVGFVGIRTRPGRRGRREVTAVETTAGTIATPRVLLTGGPALQAVAAAAGARAWVGYVRHQVAVTERSDALHTDTTAMAFDLDAGLYWRPEEGGFLFGMSNPKEPPGPGRSIDWPYLRSMQ